MLLECVPNFSEGRDASVIAAIEAATRVRGVALLDTHRDPDHNRSVLTLAGPPEALGEAVFRAVREAIARIDLGKQRGEHPRIGAADVIPFVPLAGATLEHATAAARALGERLARELALPVYFYEAAARRPDRRALPAVRNLGFEELARRAAAEPGRWAPDLFAASASGTALHPTAGAACVGARFFLVAWNVDLETRDLALAERIARAVRERSGGLPAVRAKAFRLESQGRVQVSMNLVDYRTTSPARALAAVERLAAEAGVAVARSELVGLIPREALSESAGERLRLEGFRASERVLEERLAAALPPTPDGPLGPYLDAIAAPAHAPGGGSAGALAAALGQACFEKALALAPGKGGLDASALAALAARVGPRTRWLELAARDERCFAELAASWTLPKGDPRKKAAADASIAVALDVARAATALASAAAELAGSGNPGLVNDAALAAELAKTAVRGARWNALGTRRKDGELRREIDLLQDESARASARAREAADAASARPG